MGEILATLIVGYAVCASFAWLNAYKRNALYWSDLCPPLILPLLWGAFAASGYGHQSLSHLLEVPLILICSLLLLYLRVFVLDRSSGNPQIRSYLTLGFGIVLVFLIRSFMPYMPE